MNTELNACPSCGFDRQKYEQHAKKVSPVAGEWETYCPVVVKPFYGLVGIECQNCGFTAFWQGTGTEQDIVRFWNQLPRNSS